MQNTLDHSGLVSYLKHRLAEAKENAAELHKVAMNSYGAGYGEGVVAALRETLSELGVETT